MQLLEFIRNRKRYFVAVLVLFAEICVTYSRITNFVHVCEADADQIGFEFMRNFSQHNTAHGINVCEPGPRPDNRKLEGAGPL